MSGAPDRRPWTSPYALLVVASLLWAVNMVVGRAMRAEIPPVAMAFWRWTLAFVLILPFTLPALHRRRRELARHWKVLALLGLVGICLFNTMCYIGLRLTTATNATLFNSVVPVLIPPMAWALLGERSRPLQIGGIAVSMIGVIVIVAEGDLGTLAGLAVNQGDVWLLAAMVLWSLYTVLLRFRPEGLDMLPFLTTILLFGWPMLAIWYGFELSTGASFRLSAAVAGTLLYYGIFPSVVAFVCYNRGVAAVGPSRAGIFTHLVPVFGIVLSAVLLGEPPRSHHFAGMALIFTGIVLATRPKRQAR